MCNTKNTLIGFGIILLKIATNFLFRYGLEPLRMQMCIMVGNKCINLNSLLSIYWFLCKINKTACLRCFKVNLFIQKISTIRKLRVTVFLFSLDVHFYRGTPQRHSYAWNENLLLVMVPIEKHFSNFWHK